MKHILIFFHLFLTGLGAFSQVLNWKTLPTKSSHILSAYIGTDFGLTMTLAHGYNLSKIKGLVLSEITVPAGSHLLEDYRMKSGVALTIWAMSSWRASAKLTGVFRRNETNLVRLANLGSDQSLTFGYYQSGWFAAGSIGLDKAFATHFKHSDYSKTIFLGIHDGWSSTATGGIIYFGFQGGYSTRKISLFVSLEKLKYERSTPDQLSIPIKLQLGINVLLLKI